MNRPLLIFIFTILPFSRGEAQQFINPSFEVLGTDTTRPGPPWTFYILSSTPDIQPGQWRVTREAQDGQRFVSFIFRPDSSTEYVGQRFSQPLLPNTNYNIAVWLCYSQKYGPWGGKPATIRFLGGDGFGPLIPLWSSPIIDHQEWRKYYISFTTPNVSLVECYFQAYFSGLGHNNGGVLIDNVGEIRKGRVPRIDLGADTTLCEGETIVLPLSSDSSSSFLWQDGSTAKQIEVSKPGRYILSATLDNLTIDDTIDIHYRIIPEFDLGPDTSLCHGFDLEVSAETNDSEVSYLWEDSYSEASRILSESGTYRLTVSKGRCAERDSIRLDFRDCTVVLEMPNIISPNSDGINDSFVPIEMKDVTEPEILIYDRWGRQVYTAQTLDIGWDGTYGNSLVPVGVYYWLVRYGDVYGEWYLDRGSLTLLR